MFVPGGVGEGEDGGFSGGEWGGTGEDWAWEESKIGGSSAYHILTPTLRP